LFTPPIMLLTHNIGSFSTTPDGAPQATPPPTLLVGIGMDGIDRATVTLADGTTAQARVGAHNLITFVGPAGSRIVRVEAPLPDGLAAVCDPLEFPKPFDDEIVDKELLVGVAGLACHTSRRAA